MRAMDTVLDRAWTTESFLAWEDQQDGKHELDGRDVIAITGGSVVHQRIVFNLCLALTGLRADKPWSVVHEMRLRIGRRIRYPDVTVCPGPLAPALRTLTDAVVLFEVLSDDTGTTDRVEKLIDYAAVLSLGAYVLLEQTAAAATLFQREKGGAWIATPHIAGALSLSGLEVRLPLDAVYQGLGFAAKT